MTPLSVARLSLLIAGLSASQFLHFTELSAGTIRGHVVTHEGQGPVVGANVSLPGTRYGTITDGDGTFVVSSLPRGVYEIRVTMVGYERYEKTNVVLLEDSSLVTVDVTLRESPVSVAEIIVRGRADRELETSGIRTEKEANNIVNVITAQTIERSTDRTAADVLQRVSGMSLIRSSGGEGRYLVMRGLEQRYNNTLVDGIKIPSPESKDRFVPLDIFPSALFERIEVTKALTPEIAGDAIGGSTNLLFRQAPEKMLFSFSAGAGSSSGLMGNNFNSFDRGSVNFLDPDRLHGSVSDADPTTQLGPRANPTSKDFTITNLKFTDRKVPLDGLYSLLMGNRFFDNHIGLMFAGSYQNTYNRVQTDFFSLGSDVNKIDKEGHLIPYASTEDNRIYNSNKTRGGATIKADYIIDVEHQLSATYVYVRQEEAQTRHGLQTEIDGSRGSADLTYTNRSALRIQDISSVSVAGEHFTASPISFRWTLNYTDAVQDRPDEAEYSLFQNFDPFGRLQPFQGLAGITHVWRKNDDNQYLGKLDATIQLTPDGGHVLQVGAVAQQLKRVNYQNDFKLNPAIINGRTQPFVSIDSTITTVFGQGSTSGTTVYGYQNYKADEILVSSYLQYTLNVGQLQVLAGVRWEQARDTYFTMAPISVGANEAKVTTVDFLPGIHFRYEFTPEQIGRLSLTSSMSRPSYFDLVPAYDRSDNSQSQGNPNLRPAHSTNLDIRYEFYPNPSDMYSLGFYYKHITDPIEDRFGSVGVIFVTTKGNGNPAEVYGFEAVLAKRFGGFGVSANYSYVFSEITNTKLVPVLDAFGDPTIPVPTHEQKRPLQSQSPHIVNITFSYLNEEWGTGANISYNYTGRRLLAVGLIDGYDTYENAAGELDLSVDQSLFANFKLSLKFINLLNSSVETEVSSGEFIKHDPIIIQRDRTRLRGSIGISYKL